jgi:glycosyltransferase involved in cell wall biosynthesis
MATYNGSQFVSDQVSSILSELDAADELIVVDDASTDDTLDVIRAMGDPRVAIHRNDGNLGYVRTFERALSLAAGQYVFLSDQDDVWPSGRVHVMLQALRRGAVVCGNIAVLDGPDHLRGPFGESDWRVEAGTSGHIVRNLLRLAASDMPYFGSAMAVRRDALDLALPFPRSVRELHDAWLALIGLASGTMVHIDDRVVLRRLHERNASGRVRDPWRVARGRWYFVSMCVDAWSRARRGELRPGAPTRPHA